MIGPLHLYSGPTLLSVMRYASPFPTWVVRFAPALHAWLSEAANTWHASAHAQSNPQDNSAILEDRPITSLLRPYPSFRDALCLDFSDLACPLRFGLSCLVVGGGVVKIHHYVRIVRRNRRGSRLEGFSAHTCNTSKIYT